MFPVELVNATSSLSSPLKIPILPHFNFEYLTFQAVKLTKAVGTLLHFTPEEMELVKQTLEYKMSWFGSKPKPKLGKGQQAKVIPPLY